jgi:pSer/pThr/pTyr-binding forkhead associated (FHA) protein
MKITRIIAIILLITFVGILVTLFVFGFEGLQKISVDIFLALIMAIVAGFAIDWLYRRYSPQSKILKTTVTHTPTNNISFAQLILPNNNNIIVDGAERIIGREDFVGVISTDKLLFIGKEHFKVIKKPDGFYIQDINTKNGTQINGEDLTGNDQKLLNSGDEILVGKTLKIKFTEKK